jgi:hypothetical protein
MSERKLLDTGELAEVSEFLFTTAILVGVTGDQVNYYRTRYCFEFAEEAKQSLQEWDGHGDPPGKWIVQKPEGRYHKDITD